MKFFRKLFGLDFPDPEVGQVWRSGHSGLRIRITEASIHDTGTLFVYAQHEMTEPWLSFLPKRKDEFNAIGQLYAIGAGHWRRRLREERRALVAGPGWRFVAKLGDEIN